MIETFVKSDGPALQSPIRKRWVLVTSSFPIARDGSEAAGSFVADIAQELSKYVDVRIVAPGREAAREVWGSMEVFRFPAPDHPLSLLKPWKLRDLYWIYEIMRGGLDATRKASDGAEHILALWGLPCGEWARRVARQCGIGYSVWMLGSDIWSLGRLPYLKGRLAKVMREAARVYADGYQLAADAKRIGGVEVHFLPSSRQIDGDYVSPRRHAPYRLLFLGRWHPNKGIDLLLDGLSLLTSKDWTLIESVDIHGGGPMEDLVHERVSRLQTRGCPIRVGGFLDKAQAAAAISAADWLLIPSRIESIPVVFSDAMKLGRPVVSTPVGDLGKLVGEGGVGICAASASKEAFAMALRELPVALDDHMDIALTTMAQRFSVEASALDLLSVTANAP